MPLKIPGFLEDAVAGKQKLFIAFWLWGVSGNFCLIFLFFIMTLVNKTLAGSFIVPVIFAMVQMAYFVLSMIIIWRSAFNVSVNRGWGYVARFVVINSPLIFIIIIAVEYFLLLGINYS